MKAKCRKNRTAYLVLRGQFIRLRRPNVQVFKFLGGNLDWQVVCRTLFFVITLICKSPQNSYQFFWLADDFVLPAFIACLSHACYLVATSAIYAYSSQIILTGSSCLDEHNLNIYVRLLTFIISFIKGYQNKATLNLYVVVSNCNQLHDSGSYTLPNSRHSFCKRLNLG